MLTLDTIRQRVTTGVALTGLALSLTLGFTAAAAPSAHAEPNGTGGSTLCYWDGKAYSPGGTVVATDSRGTTHTYKCMSDGSWEVVLRVTQPRPGYQLPGQTAPLAP